MIQELTNSEIGTVNGGRGKRKCNYTKNGLCMTRCSLLQAVLIMSKCKDSCRKRYNC